MREARLCWFGYVQRRKDVKGIRSRKAQDSWLDCVKPDMVEVQLTTRDANDQNKWKKSCSKRILRQCGTNARKKCSK
ncbi:hypothetical protein ANCCAN_13252 [Ancylostoma caninum]|uniref:Uncharacterized protein n=1 Tax=Ancylostoma caninum TaxID=29170 RepID=A0A368GDC2_ANCCA|nr:hypothetical protein ANCCAN_13252 [Ancylostoma caninum]